MPATATPNQNPSIKHSRDTLEASPFEFIFMVLHDLILLTRPIRRKQTVKTASSLLFLLGISIFMNVPCN
ncbi:unnamed protein product [Sphenostylis stenocarpa]|uniref:Uncharacterized protein n=1 Tax=Sphenostylis stenocarpa TaxID=92480 RepID=A0AA86SAV7_9FABA|nr:unnamed protein product [Sphenostylis stenocarpa]